MREEIRYIADDGKVFNDEYECKEYELKKRSKGLAIKALDVTRNELPLDKISEAFYLYIPTLEDLEYIQDLGRYEGFSTPNDIGRFYFDESRSGGDMNYWFNIDDTISELKEEIQVLDEFFKEE